MRVYPGKYSEFKDIQVVSEYYTAQNNRAIVVLQQMHVVYYHKSEKVNAVYITSNCPIMRIEDIISHFGDFWLMTFVSGRKVAAGVSASGAVHPPCVHSLA